MNTGITSFIRNYRAYEAHLSSTSHKNPKAEGICKILLDKNVMAFILILKVQFIYKLIHYIWLHYESSLFNWFICLIIFIGYHYLNSEKYSYLYIMYFIVKLLQKHFFSLIFIIFLGLTGAITKIILATSKIGDNISGCSHLGRHHSRCSRRLQ